MVIVLPVPKMSPGSSPDAQQRPQSGRLTAVHSSPSRAEHCGPAGAAGTAPRLRGAEVWLWGGRTPTAVRSQREVGGPAGQQWGSVRLRGGGGGGTEGRAARRGWKEPAVLPQLFAHGASWKADGAAGGADGLCWRWVGGWACGPAWPCSVGAWGAAQPGVCPPPALCRPPSLCAPIPVCPPSLVSSLWPCVVPPIPFGSCRAVAFG